jgi:hypothetical protein
MSNLKPLVLIVGIVVAALAFTSVAQAGPNPTHVSEIVKQDPAKHKEKHKNKPDKIAKHKNKPEKNKHKDKHDKAMKAEKEKSKDEKEQ